MHTSKSIGVSCLRNSLKVPAVADAGVGSESTLPPAPRLCVFMCLREKIRVYIVLSCDAERRDSQWSVTATPHPLFLSSPSRRSGSCFSWLKTGHVTSPASDLFAEIHRVRAAMSCLCLSQKWVYNLCFIMIYNFSLLFLKGILDMFPSGFAFVLLLLLLLCCNSRRD